MLRWVNIKCRLWADLSRGQRSWGSAFLLLWPISRNSRTCASLGPRTLPAQPLSPQGRGGRDLSCLSCQQPGLSEPGPCGWEMQDTLSARVRRCWREAFVCFVVVQLLSRVQLFATLRTAARQASLSLTVSRSLLTLTSIESVMPSNHLILCCLLLLPPSIFPSIRVFSSELALHIRWPKYWSFRGCDYRFCSSFFFFLEQFPLLVVKEMEIKVNRSLIFWNYNIFCCWGYEEGVSYTLLVRFCSSIENSATKAGVDVFWNSVTFSMIQRMLAIWSLVPLPFLNPAWTSGSSWFMCLGGSVSLC